MEHLYDTHYHLDLQANRDAAIQEIEKNHIYTIAVTNLPDLYKRETVEITNKFIRLSLGFHPELLHQFKNQIPLMWELLPSVRYVGEVGLDFTDLNYKQEQIEFFEGIVERCYYMSNKIMTIHSRRATKTILDIIGDNCRFKPILHWFTGTRKDLESAVERGYYFSVNEKMLKTGKTCDMLHVVPKERLLLETDSPFANNKQRSHTEELMSIKSQMNSINDDFLWKNFTELICTK